MDLNFQIGDISRFFDLPASTLRYWEEKGVLTPSKDSLNHYREYAVEDLMTISDVIFYKNLGLSLNQIRKMESATPKQQRGLTISSDCSDAFSDREILWKKKSNRYVAFLMKEEVTEGFPNDLLEHLQYIKQHYRTGAVISRFLLCAQENGKVYDFYKTFAEI